MRVIVFVLDKDAVFDPCANDWFCFIRAFAGDFGNIATYPFLA